MHAPGLWQLIIILLIVVVLFGTKKLRNIGADLGAAIKNFRQSVQEGERGEEARDQTGGGEGRIIDVDPNKDKDKEKV
jgi:sec-independent protein translocase protein TatA